MATRLRSCEDHPSPSEFASKGMKWLRGYAVVKTTPPPRNLLVREWNGYAATRLRSCEDNPSPSEFVCKGMKWLRSCEDHPSPSEFVSKGMKWLRGYAVVKTTPPPRNLLVREWSGYAATQL